MVVGLVKDDGLVPSASELFDIVRRVIDVDIGSHIGLVAEEAKIAIRDLLRVEPLHGVGNRSGVTPVHIQTVGDDSDMDASIR